MNFKSNLRFQIEFREASPSILGANACISEQNIEVSVLVLNAS